MITAERITEEVAEQFGCEVCLIRSGQKVDRVVEARQAVVYLVRKHVFNISLKELAKYLNYKNTSSVSRINKKAWDNFEVNLDFRHKLLAADREVTLIKLGAKL